MITLFGVFDITSPSHFIIITKIIIPDINKHLDEITVRLNFGYKFVVLFQPKLDENANETRYYKQYG